MRRWGYITIVTLSLAMTVLAAVQLSRRYMLSPEWSVEVSDDYRLFRDCPGVTPTYIQGLRVNDTFCVDATVLHATSDSGWRRIVEEYALPDPAGEAGADEERVFAGQRAMSESGEGSVIMYSFKTRFLTVFHSHNNQQRKQLLHYCIKRHMLHRPESKENNEK